MYEDITTAALYVRYSSSNQTEQSIEGQVRVCKEFCERHNIAIVEIYADRATSASKNIEKRLEFHRMIKDSEKRLFQAVIVYKLDRFARSRYDSANFKYRLKRNGVRLISATENLTDNPESIILESVLEGMAEFYSAELSQKILRGMKESAYKHNSTGGRIPLGYKIENKKYVIDPATAPIVREAFQRYAAGETVAEICRRFNAAGYRTSKGSEFNRNSFKTMFANPRYVGTYKYQEYTAENAIPAIIDRPLFEQVQERLKNNAKAPSRGKAKVRFLLAQKLFCGHCGGHMNGDTGTGRHGGRYNYYVCYEHKCHKTCDKTPIRKEFIERAVTQDALNLLTDDVIKELAQIAVQENEREIQESSRIPALRQKVAEINASLNNIANAVERGIVPDTLLKRMVDLEKERQDLEVQIVRAEKDIVHLDESMVIRWLTKFTEGTIEDEDFCRRILDLLVNSVTVWDEPDGWYKITTAYNLTSIPTKTYRISRSDGGSDLGCKPAPMQSGFAQEISLMRSRFSYSSVSSLPGLRLPETIR